MKYEVTASRLREALNDNGMKAQELSDLSGVKKASVSHYVNGSHSPSNLSAGNMAKVLGVNPVWLMGFDVPKTADFTLTQRESALLSSFRQLNEDGQDKVMDYIDDILDSPKYKKGATFEALDAAENAG